MNSMKNITILASVLLLSTGISSEENTAQDSLKMISVQNAVKPQPVTNDTVTKNDTTSTKSVVNTFFELETKRKKIFDYDSVLEFKNPYLILSPELYRKNATSFSDAMRYHPLFTSVRYGLSSSLNRNLLYGTVAPVTTIWSDKIFSQNTPYSLFPINAENQFTTENEFISINNNGIHFFDYPVKTAIPEIVILWENGVFGENILDVRITRPITRNIMLNLFSNYRHFDGTEFSHDANDIFTFYSNFYNDTSDISHSGYNPEVEEYVTGIQLRYCGQKGNSIDFQLKYSDLFNELAIDTVSSTKDQMYEIYHRYPINARLFSNANTLGKLFWDLGISFQNEPITRTQPSIVSTTGGPIRTDGSYNNFSLFLQSGKTIRSDDSIGISITGSNIKSYRFNRDDWSNLLSDSRLFYSLNRSSINNTFSADLNCGVKTNSDDSTIALNSVWHAGCDLTGKHNNLRIFVKADDIPNLYLFDTTDTVSRLSFDNYFQGGLEYLFHTEKVQLLLGYQYLSDINDLTVSRSWPSEIPPYLQPQSTILVAPSIGRWKGFSLCGSTSFSDEKPYFKASSRFSYIFHPLSTSEYVDLNLGFEYWSEREMFTFAGRSDWNKPIYNLDLDISVHILSFRLFYKVDNILNRKFAYIPGYYSSGLTFRWGFNWFIQR